MRDASKRVVVGNWIEKNGRVVGDAQCDRINDLVTGKLVKIAGRDGGWTTLYQDPRDGAYWELTYPHSSMQGGGPPTLTEMKVAEVRKLYGLESE